MPSICVIQMQRMGDLILTWPLTLWLARRYPGHRVFVLGEEHFYRPLLAVGPKELTYVPWNRAEAIQDEPFELVVNVSHRPEAALLAGRLAARSGARVIRTIGEARDASGSRVRGDFALYRLSLTHNNRHNRFHWADMNALDAVGPEAVRETSWPAPAPAGSGAVGVFVGASEAAKRPGPDFWAAFLRELDKRGLKPVVFGGPGDVDLAAEAVGRSGTLAGNLAGRLTLDELARAFASLDLLATPDTGPMHLAAWAGTPVLNLSLGPVHGWETGPYQPGHHVLAPRMSCRGCWRCERPGKGEGQSKEDEALSCRTPFAPARVAVVAEALAKGRAARLSGLKPPGLGLFRSGRDASGLYDLASVFPASGPPVAREAVSRLWDAFFRDLFELPSASMDSSASARAAELASGWPRLAGNLARAAGRVLDNPATDWWAFPPLVRPLTGWLELARQNGKDASAPDRVAAALDHLDALTRLLAG